jgi:DNA-binding response OmpR family regulator
MGKNILLVDDDEELRSLSEKYLQRNGFEVSVASDGWDAIRQIVVDKPDLVIMDIEMPKLSGLNALDILRVSRLTDQLPIIVTSAHGDKDTILRAVQLGADDFMVKPYSFTELSMRVGTHLFHLDFASLQKVLASLNRPAEVKPTAFWSGLEASRYVDWGAFTCTFEERDLCVLLQQGLTIDQALKLNETQALSQVLVLAKARSRWKCVWPTLKPQAAIRSKAA